IPRGGQTATAIRTAGYSRRCRVRVHGDGNIGCGREGGCLSMHVCEEFRERITEKLLDRSELDTDRDVQRELLVCNSCADFYAESKEMIEAFASVHFDVSDSHLDLMADRLRVKIHEDSERRQRQNWRSWFMPYVPAFAGALALLLVTVGLY